MGKVSTVVIVPFGGFPPPLPKWVFAVGRDGCCGRIVVHFGRRVATRVILATFARNLLRARRQQPVPVELREIQPAPSARTVNRLLGSLARVSARYAAARRI